MIEFLNEHLMVFYALVFLFGVMLGSFLNVVIYRLPIMLQRSWLNDCKAFLHELQTNNKKSPYQCPACLAEHNTPIAIDEFNTQRFNLATPASACPHCAQKIRAYDNIPLLSYCLLAGKCRHCAAPISIRYPIVELLSATLCVLAAVQFGVGMTSILVMVFCLALLALSVIDLDHQVLPDSITLPLLWLGLIINAQGIFTSLHAAVMGAIIGYLSLWMLFQGHRMLTGREGMGHGDFKLLATMGAWMGWQLLPVIILISSCTGLIAGVCHIIFHKQAADAPFAFGPHIALAGAISLLYGDIRLFFI